MAVKFSEFTIESIAGNVSYLVGYSGTTNIRINPGNLLLGVIPYTGAISDVDLGLFGITSSQFIKSGGTSSQFLKADGSIDSNTYLTASSGYVPYTGALSDLDLGTHTVTATSIIKVGGTSMQYLMADGSISSGPSFAGYVPYTGATNNLDLGIHAITATAIYKVGGTSSQFLMADGSTSLGPADYVPYSGATQSLNLGLFGVTASQFIKNGGTSFQFLKADGSVDSVNYYPYPTGSPSQYVRGDGQLSSFPSSGGGGSSVSYYLNGGINSDVIGYKQMDNEAVIGVGTNFPLTGNGLIAQFLTDIGNPNRVQIPGGAWNFEMFFSVSSVGGSPEFYVDLLKYDGIGFDLIATGSTNPEVITGGNSIDLYLTSIAVPTTELLSTDRLAVRVYIVNNSEGRTVTLHTEDNTLCEIITTFSGGVTSLNGLTANTQYLAVGTSGVDFNIDSLNDTHTFNLPTASSIYRGALSSSDWSMFNAKQNALIIGNLTSTTNDISVSGGEAAVIGSGTSLTLSNTTVVAGSYGNGINIPYITVDSKGRVTQLSTTAIPTAGVLVTGLLSSSDWNTFYNKQSPITLTTTGNSGAATFIGGTLNIPQYTGGMSIGGAITSATQGSVLFVGALGVLEQSNANFFWDNTNKRLGIGTVTPATFLNIYTSNSNPAKTEMFRMEVKNSANTVTDYFKFTLGATTARGGSIIFGETGGGFPEAGLEFNLNHTILYQGGAYPIYLKTNNVNRVTVTSTGTVLMNQTTDDLINKLQLTGSAKITATSAAVSATLFTLFSGSTFFTGSNDANTGYSLNFDAIGYGSGNYFTRTGAQIQMLKTGSWNRDISGTSYSNLVFSLNNSATNTLIERMRLSYNGNLLINSAIDDLNNKLQVTGNTKLTGELIVTSRLILDSISQNYLPKKSSSIFDNGALTNSVIYDNNGKIGIGNTATGTEALQVTGNIYASGTVYSNGNVLIGTSTPYVPSRLYIEQGYSGDVCLTLFGNGFSGNIFETYDSSYNKTIYVDIYGKMTLGSVYPRPNGADTKLLIQQGSWSTDGVLGLYGDSFGVLITGLDGNSVEAFRVDNDGSVSNVNGIYGTFSDLRLKENIIPATPKLDDLLKVNIVNYNLIKDDNKLKQIGVIAQELEKIFPALVSDDKDGIKSVKTSLFIPMLIKAMQEQQTQIEELKQLINK